MKNHPPNASSGKTRTYWVNLNEKTTYEKLTNDINVDVVVVGGGIAGLTIAYTLLKRGKSVAVLEDGVIGSGETGRTSAHLASCLDDRYYELINRFGEEDARLIARSHEEAIDTLEKIIADENIHCNFKRVDGYLFSHKDDDDELNKEAKALEKLSVAFEWAERAPITSFDTGPCLKFLNQAQFNPEKYIEGLAKAIVKHGGQIFESTHVEKIEDNPCRVHTDDNVIVNAGDVVVATGSPVNDRLYLHTKQAQYRTYIIGISLPRGEVTEALYWDTLEKYHYIRIVPSAHQDQDYVLVGGEDHKTGQKKSPKEAFAALEQWAKERFSPHAIIFQWSGQIVEPIDRLAFIGRNPHDKHVYVHTGHSGNGLTYAAIAANVLADVITGQKSDYEKIYKPSRKTPKAALTFLEETLNMVAQYRDWLKLTTKNVDDIENNQGAVLRKGLALRAIYKDENGTVHHLSPICPHLGGIVRWNNLEKTWDCPCHGSRFTGEGEVLNGPAPRNLKTIKKRK